MNTQSIRVLIDKFFAGETTLAEERRLYAYFSRTDLPAEFAPLRALFTDLGTVGSPFAGTSKFRVWRKVVAVAASVVLICGVGYTAVRSYQSRQLARQYAGSYIIMDGVRQTDLRAIRTEIEQTLSLADAIECDLSPQGLGLQIENEVLQQISDLEERQRIESLLK
ncbi:MAG: hypothetical protein IJ816_02180 [Alloprevotella sp.]|nr:hypothetical protein [Alloprevotella sp.]